MALVASYLNLRQGDLGYRPRSSPQDCGSQGNTVVSYQLQRGSLQLCHAPLRHCHRAHRARSFRQLLNPVMSALTVEGTSFGAGGFASESS